MMTCHSDIQLSLWDFLEEPYDPLIQDKKAIYLYNKSKPYCMSCCVNVDFPEQFREYYYIRQRQLLWWDWRKDVKIIYFAEWMNRNYPELMVCNCGEELI